MSRSPLRENRHEDHDVFEDQPHAGSIDELNNNNKNRNGNIVVTKNNNVPPIRIQQQRGEENKKSPSRDDQKKQQKADDVEEIQHQQESESDIPDPHNNNVNVNYDRERIISPHARTPASEGGDNINNNQHEEYQDSDHPEEGDHERYGSQEYDENNQNQIQDDDIDEYVDRITPKNDDENDNDENREEQSHQQQEMNTKKNEAPSFQIVGAAERFGLDEEQSKLSPALLRIHRKSLAQQQLEEEDPEHAIVTREVFFNEDENRDEKNIATHYDRKFEASAKRTRPFEAKTEQLVAPTIIITTKANNASVSPSKSFNNNSNNNKPTSPAAPAATSSPVKAQNKPADTSSSPVPVVHHQRNENSSPSRRKSSVSSKNKDETATTQALNITLKRTPPYRASWLQWRPTDVDQLKNAERVLLAPVFGRYVQNKIASLNTLSFLPPKEIIERLKDLELLSTNQQQQNESPSRGGANNRKRSASASGNGNNSNKKTSIVLRHLIFVHGLAGGAATWLPQLKYFADLFDKKNYVAVFGDQVLEQFDQEEKEKQENSIRAASEEENKILKESQHRLPLADSFFASSFVSPNNRRFHQNNHNNNSNEKSFMSGAVTSTNHHNQQLLSSSLDKSSLLPAASPSRSQRRSTYAAYAPPPPTAEEMEKSARSQSRKNSKLDKVTIHIVHAIDLPGFCRSDRDASVENFEGAPAANEYMTKRLDEWAKAMDFENVDKWLAQMRLPNVVTTTSSPKRNRTGNNNNNNDASSSSQLPLEIASPENNSSSILVTSPSPQQRLASPKRARSVIIILHDDDDDNDEGKLNKNNNEKEPSKSPSPVKKTKQEKTTAVENHQPDHDDSHQQQQIQNQRNDDPSNNSINGIPRRIGAEFSFRRKGGEIDEHIKNFEQSQNHRRNSLSVSASTRTAGASQESSHMEDVPEQDENDDDNHHHLDDNSDDDDDDDSENDYYKEAAQKERYNPHPTATTTKKNNNNNNKNNYPANDYHEPIHAASVRERRQSIRSSQFIVPGEDSTFKNKKERSSSVDMTSLFATSGNNDQQQQQQTSSFPSSPSPKTAEEKAKVNFRGKFYTIKEIRDDKHLQDEFTFGENKKFRSGRKSHITWCAHSYGAYLCSLLACDSPDSFDHLVLADVWGMEAKPCEENDKETFYEQMPCVWSCLGSCAHSSKSLPFDAIRRAGMFGPSLLESVRPAFGARWKSIISDSAYFYDYFYHAIAQENPTGELALAHASEKYSFAAIPLRDIIIKKLPLRVDLSLFYGANTFMESSFGLEVATTLRSQRREVFERSKKIADDIEREEQEKYRKEKEKREQLWKHAEDKYDREFMSESRILRREKEEAIEEKQKEDYVMKLPRIGSVSYEVVPKAGHHLCTENAFAFNKLVQGSLEVV